MNLAPYAASGFNSRGRRFAEPSPAHRSEFQRDRDRIIHCAAFRRLEYKTQVFINHEGDLFRTRLTHSIEVAQIARSIARALQLNEDLSEAISLAHDLGHTPFGHSGQDALNECMRDHGGFEHNMQSLRVVDLLEERYADFTGLNLTFETREGILKHCSAKNARELGELGQRFLQRTQPSLEAQVVNLADEIAYNHHDVDDGLRAGLVRDYPALAVRRRVYETVRRMIGTVVTDLIETSATQIGAAGVADIDDVRRYPEALITYSNGVREQTLELKRFLRKHLYAHAEVRRKMDEAEKVIAALFEAFMQDVRRLPQQYQDKLEEPMYQGQGGPARLVADYIAGMTDRFAVREYNRLFGACELG